jgi:dihydrofolate reductase
VTRIGKENPHERHRLDRPRRGRGIRRRITDRTQDRPDRVRHRRYRRRTAWRTDWNHSTILRAYSADAIRDLKDRVDGGIYVSGSGTLVQAMLADGLVDELHLFVYPLAQGASKRLFADSGTAIKLALAGSEAYSNGALHLTYGPRRRGAESRPLYPARGHEQTPRDMSSASLTGPVDVPGNAHRSCLGGTGGIASTSSEGVPHHPVMVADLVILVEVAGVAPA